MVFSPEHHSPNFFFIRCCTNLVLDGLSPREKRPYKPRPRRIEPPGRATRRASSLSASETFPLLKRLTPIYHACMISLPNARRNHPILEPPYYICSGGNRATNHTQEQRRDVAMNDSSPVRRHHRFLNQRNDSSPVRRHHRSLNHLSRPTSPPVRPHASDVTTPPLHDRPHASGATTRP